MHQFSAMVALRKMSLPGKKCAYASAAHPYPGKTHRHAYSNVALLQEVMKGAGLSAVNPLKPNLCTETGGPQSPPKVPASTIHIQLRSWLASAPSPPHHACHASKVLQGLKPTSLHSVSCQGLGQFFLAQREFLGRPGAFILLGFVPSPP